MSDYNEIMKNLKEAVSGMADAAKDIASAAGGAAKDFASGAGDKARTLGRIAKLKLDIGAENEKLREAYAEIGKLCFEMADKRHPDPMYVRMFDQVMISRANVSNLEDELAELHAALGEEAVDEAVEADFESVVSADEEQACTDDACPIVLKLDGEDDDDITVEITQEPEE